MANSSIRNAGKAMAKMIKILIKISYAIIARNLDTKRKIAENAKPTKRRVLTSKTLNNKHLMIPIKTNVLQL